MLHKLKTNHHLLSLLLCIILAGGIVLLSFFAEAATGESIQVPDAFSEFIEVSYSVTGSGEGGQAYFYESALVLEAASTKSDGCGDEVYSRSMVTVYVTVKKPAQISYSANNASNGGTGSGSLGSSLNDVVIPAGTTFQFTLTSSDNSTDKASYSIDFTKMVAFSGETGGAASYYIPSDKNGKYFYFYLDEAISAAAASGGNIIVAASGKVCASGASGSYVSYDSSGNPTFTIPSGVQLLVPCATDDNGDFDTKPTEANHTSSYSYLAPIYNAEAYTYTHTASGVVTECPVITYSYAYRSLTVPSGTTIVLAGKMNVNARIYVSAGRDTTCPNGPYGELVLEEGATLEVADGGYLYCYGFITGTVDADKKYTCGQVIASSGATVYELLQVRDWRGGTDVMAFVTGQYQNFPIAQYYVQNIETDYLIYSGASSGIAFGVNLSGADYFASAIFLGNGGLFEFTEGFGERTYDPSTDRITYTLREGSMILDGITMNDVILTYDLISNNYILGLNSNITLTVGAGSTATVKSRVKMLPGSRVNVEEGAILNVESGGALYIYDSTSWNSKYTVWAYTTHRVSAEDNGTVTAILDNRNTASKVVRYSPARARVNGADTAVKTPSYASARLHVDGTLNCAGNVYTSSGYTTNNTSYTSTTKTDMVLSGTGTFVTSANWETNGNENTLYGELEEFYNGATRVYIPCTPVVGNIVTGSQLPTTYSYGWALNTEYYGFFQDVDDDAIKDPQDYFWYTERPSATIHFLDENQEVLETWTTYFFPGTDLSGYYTDQTCENAAPSSYDGSTIELYLPSVARVDWANAAPSSYYPSLNAAVVNALNAEDQVHLLRDTVIDVAIKTTASQNCYVFLGGHTIAHSTYVFNNYGVLNLDFQGGTIHNLQETTTDSEGLVTTVSNVSTYAILNRSGGILNLNLNGGTLKWSALADYNPTKTFYIIYNYSGGTANIDLNGGTIELDCPADFSITSSIRVHAIRNDGVMTIQNTGATGAVTSNLHGASRVSSRSTGATSYENATIYNGSTGTLTLQNVTVSNTSTYTSKRYHTALANRGTIEKIQDSLLYCKSAYSLINCGGKIALIDGMTSSYVEDGTTYRSYFGIYNYSTRATSYDDNGVANGYTAGAKGVIEVITDSDIQVTQYAIFNKAYIGTINGSTYLYTTANSGHTIYNHYKAAYDTQAYTYVTDGANRTYLYEEVPTIDCITGNVQIIAYKRLALSNYGYIREISGNVLIQAKSTGTTNTNYYYALGVVGGGYIESITGSVSIKASDVYAIYVSGQQTSRLDRTYTDDGLTLIISGVYTYRPSRIGTIDGNVTITAARRTVFNRGQIDAIGGNVVIKSTATGGSYDVIFNDVGSTYDSSTDTTTYNTTATQTYTYSFNEDGTAVYDSDGKQVYTVENQVAYTPTIGKIGGTDVQIIASGYRAIYISANSKIEEIGGGNVLVKAGRYAIYNSGTIQKIADGAVVVSTASSSYYALYNGGTVELISGGDFYHGSGRRERSVYNPDSQKYPDGYSLSTKTRVVTVNGTPYNCYFVHTHSFENCLCIGCDIFRFYATNVNLGNNLDMMFAFPAGVFAEGTDLSGYYALFTHVDGTTTRLEFEDWQTLNINGSQSEDGEDYYMVFYSFPAKQMADTVSVTIYDGSDKAVSISKTDSIQAYAGRMLKKATTSDALKNVIVTMLNYGSACQVQFGYKTEALANSILDEELRKTYEQKTGDGISITPGAATPSIAGHNLKVESNIIFHIALNGVAKDTDVTVSFIGHKGNNVSYTTTVNDDYSVEITGLVVADHASTITLTIGNTILLTSIDAYISNMGEGETNNVFYAFNQFAAVAYAYQHPKEATA